MLVAAETDTDFVLYDDDGHTTDYKKGVYAKTDIRVKAGDQTVISFNRTGTYPSTIETIDLRLVSKKKGAFWVSVAGHKIDRYLIRERFEEAQSGWYYDLSDRTICVKFPAPKEAAFDVVVSTEKFDLIGMNED